LILTDINRFIFSHILNKREFAFDIISDQNMENIVLDIKNAEFTSMESNIEATTLQGIY